MNKSNELFIDLILSIILLGCATVPPPILEKEIQRDKIYNKSFDEVWNAVLDISAQQTNIFIELSDKNSGLLSYNGNLSGKEINKYVSSLQKGFYKDQYKEGRVHARLTIRPVTETRTSVRINTRFEGTEYGLFTTTIVNSALASNGTFEEEFFSMIDAKLGLKEYKWMR